MRFIFFIWLLFFFNGNNEPEIIIPKYNDNPGLATTFEANILALSESDAKPKFIKLESSGKKITLEG